MGGRKDNYMSSSEDEDVDNGKNRPEPIHDGLPQVSWRLSYKPFNIPSSGISGRSVAN